MTENRRNSILTDRRRDRCNAPFRETNVETGEWKTVLCNLEYGHKPRRHTRKNRRAKDRDPKVLDRRDAR